MSWPRIARAALASNRSCAAMNFPSSWRCSRWTRPAVPLGSFRRRRLHRYPGRCRAALRRRPGAQAEGVLPAAASRETSRASGRALPCAGTGRPGQELHESVLTSSMSPCRAVRVVVRLVEQRSWYGWSHCDRRTSSGVSRELRRNMSRQRGGDPVAATRGTACCVESFPASPRLQYVSCTASLASSRGQHP